MEIDRGLAESVITQRVGVGAERFGVYDHIPWRAFGQNPPDGRVLADLLNRIATKLTVNSSYFVPILSHTPRQLAN